MMILKERADASEIYPLPIKNWAMRVVEAARVPHRRRHRMKEEVCPRRKPHNLRREVLLNLRRAAMLNAPRRRRNRKTRRDNLSHGAAEFS